MPFSTVKGLIIRKVYDAQWACTSAKIMYNSQVQFVPG